ncbi:MAG: type III pantothenate kinase [Candidatus Thiodiazotropha sp.]
MDFGNSDVKWATGEELKQERVHRVASKDQMQTLIQQLKAHPRPSHVYIASVLRSERLHELSSWMDATWQISPVFAYTCKSELGVVNGYRNPEQLGVDRWLGLLAGRAISKRPQLIVDCGTATTMDAMDAEGRHLGGAILPGLALFNRCLQAQTDLPVLKEHAEIDRFATDTAAGIASGAMLATSSSIETMLDRVRKVTDRDTDCLLTGGFASQVAGHLTSPHRLVPYLILQGLSLQAGQKDRQ